MGDTPYFDLSGLDKDEHDHILDTARQNCDWMLAVYAPGRETHHVLCLWFEDGEPSEFKKLLRSIFAPNNVARALHKLYAADYAMHKSGIDIMGATARAFRVDATRTLEI